MEKFNKRFMVKAAVAGILMIFALGLFLFGGNKDKDMEINNISNSKVEETTSSAMKEKEEEPKEIIVHVDGQVNKPKVVKLPEGSRVFEAIEEAKGLTSNADSKQLNLAARLNDGDKIYVPALGEALSSINAATENQSNVPDFININTAASEELQILNGIGPAMAEKIITYRNEDGPFKKIEDLKNVSGIGDKTFEKLMDKICVN